MEPARSLAITRSQTSGFEPGLDTSTASSARPAVLIFWLWQVMQYVSRNVLGSLVGDFAGAPQTATATAPPPIRSATGITRPGHERRQNICCVSSLKNQTIAVYAMSRPRIAAFTRG